MNLKLKIEDPELSEYLNRVAERQGKTVEEIVVEALIFISQFTGKLFAMMDHYKRMVALAKEEIDS